MGKDKARLKTPTGMNLLQHCQQLFRTAGVQKLWLSSNSEIDGIKDNFPGAGPLAGIEAVLPFVESEFAVIMPVDMPLISASAIQRLLLFSEVNKQSCCYQDKCLPLVVYHPKVAYKNVLEILKSGNKASIWRFCKAIGCTEIDVAEEVCFDNANTPEDWRACKAKLREGSRFAGKC